MLDKVLLYGPPLQSYIICWGNGCGIMVNMIVLIVSVAFVCILGTKKHLNIFQCSISERADTKSYFHSVSLLFIELLRFCITRLSDVKSNNTEKNDRCL